MFFVVGFVQRMHDVKSILFKCDSVCREQDIYSGWKKQYFFPPPNISNRLFVFVLFPCAHRSCIAILDHFSVFSPCVLWRIFIQGVCWFILDLSVSTLHGFTCMYTGCEALRTFIGKKVPLVTQKVDARSCKEQHKRGFHTVCELTVSSICHPAHIETMFDWCHK